MHRERLESLNAPATGIKLALAGIFAPRAPAAIVPRSGPVNEETKVCIECGCQFVNWARVSPSNWARRRFHDRECWAEYARGTATNQRQWSDDEITVLRERYESDGSRSALAALPSKTITAVLSKAHKLGLVSGLRAGGAMKKREG